MEDLNAKYLTIKTSVVVPGLQALVNGVFFGGAVGGCVAIANSVELLKMPSWAVGCAVGCVAGLRAWHNLLHDWRVLLYGTYVPSERDSCPVDPEPVRVELFSDNGNRGQYANLPASVEQLAELGRGIVAGDSFSVSRWTGSHGPFSRGEFEQLRGEMLKLGWLEWKSVKDNARGVTVTRGGAAVFRHFASMTTSPPSLRR